MNWYRFIELVGAYTLGAVIFKLGQIIALPGAWILMAVISLAFCVLLAAIDRQKEGK